MFLQSKLVYDVGHIRFAAFEGQTLFSNLFFLCGTIKRPTKAIIVLDRKS